MVLAACLDSVKISADGVLYKTLLLCTYSKENINLRDFQRKHVVNNVDMSSLRAP